jgi:hypothetical protein
MERTLGWSDSVAVKLCGSCREKATRSLSTLAMADPGAHPTFFLSQFAAALARFLDSHAVLQSVTDPDCWETL